MSCERLNDKAYPETEKHGLDPLLSEKQLCAWIGIGQATAARWRQVGIGPRFVVLGLRRLAYRKSDIERWLAENEQSHGGVKRIVADGASEFK